MMSTEIDRFAGPQGRVNPAREVKRKFSEQNEPPSILTAETLTPLPSDSKATGLHNSHVVLNN